MVTMAAYDNRSVFIPGYDNSMPYVTEKFAKITVNPFILRPKTFLKKDSVPKKQACCRLLLCNKARNYNQNLREINRQSRNGCF